MTEEKTPRIEQKIEAGPGATVKDVQQIVYLRPPLGVPFQAPAVPRYFIPRPEVSQALMDYLTADAPPGALVVSAVHGLGGIGKTTLVAALAHDPVLQARFPDGILWATLGQQPDVLSFLSGWIQALGDRDFHLTLVESASSHLRTLLHDKVCLLVVDDAWQADHVRPFLVGGERCRVLVTTRDAVLAHKVGAHLYDLDVMTEAQALALFEARLGALDGDRVVAAALARELGYLPLALELAAAQMEAGVLWDELLTAFRQGLADLAVLDLDEATYRNESLRLSFRLSLEQFSPEDQEAFAWLGVLPEDARLNPVMAATLWNQLETDARKRLRRLRDKALLKPVVDDQYTFHDLLHDEAKLRLLQQMPLPEAHTALLERYRAYIQDGLWHTLPDDGYVHEHLTWHMEQAGQPEAIHALLCLETSEGRNAWYEAHERLGQTAGYLDDVRCAWRLAEEEFATHHSQVAIGFQCRYALIIASLNSLAGNLPLALLAALVENRMWTAAQGLTYARQSPDEWRRAVTLAGLAPHLPAGEQEAVLTEALAAARYIEYEWRRAEALAGLAPHLPAELMGEALSAAHGIEDEGWRAEALAGLAPHLPAELMGEALSAARGIENEGRRAKVLAGLAPHLPAELMGEALTAARGIEKEGIRAKALVSLAPYLPEPLLREVLSAARGIEGGWGRRWALASLAPHLLEPLRREVLHEALAAARELQRGWDRVWALVWLAPHLLEPLRGEILHEVLAAVQEIRHEEDRENVLTALATQLAESGYPKEASVATREIGRERSRTEVVARLVPCLAERGYPREALAAAREMLSEGARAKALATLSPHLLGSLKEEVVQEALVAAAQALPDERAEALVRLASHLPESLLQEALTAAREIGYGHGRAKALVGLASRLGEPLLWEALAAAQEIGDESVQSEALVGLALQLMGLGHSQVVLVWVRGIRNRFYRAKALASLSPHLPEPMLWEALAAVQEIEYEGSRMYAMVGLAPRLAELGYPQEALTAALKIGNERSRAKALAGLAPHLEGPFLQETLAAAREIRDEGDQAKVLVRLALRLAELGYPQDALAAVREIKSGSKRAEALAAVREIKYGSERAEALTELAPHLPKDAQEGVLQEALTLTQEIRNERDRAKALASLVPRLAELSPAAMYPFWRKMLYAPFTRTREGLLANLRAIAPIIAALGGEQAIAETGRAIQDVARWWP